MRLSLYRVCWHVSWTALISRWSLSPVLLRCCCVRLSSIAQYSPLLPLIESCPCFSAGVAVHTFIPATDPCLGWLLSIQLANPLSAPLNGRLPIFYSPVRLSTCMCWSPSLALSLRQYQTLSPWSSFDLVVFLPMFIPFSFFALYSVFLHYLLFVF